MSANDIQVLLGSAGAFILILSGGGKWLLTHIDALQAKSSLLESTAREALSNRLHEEIRVLRVELVESHKISRLYLRRIHQLEGFIHTQPGIDIPAMDGWPPT